jgi:maleamate amidohydrolase
MTDQYAAKGYGSREIGFGTRLGILVVDFQKGFTDTRFAMAGSPHVEAAVERTIELLQVARLRGIPVAASVAGRPKGASPHYWKTKASQDELIFGSEALDLDPRIEAVGVDFGFAKTGASAFFGTTVSAFFTKRGVDTVCITGCTSSGCVRASAVDAFQNGFRTMLVDDCCGDQELQPHLDTLRDVGRRYADIVTADDVIRRMMANSEP